MMMFSTTIDAFPTLPCSRRLNLSQVRRIRVSGLMLPMVLMCSAAINLDPFPNLPEVVAAVGGFILEVLLS